jgi:hypothetical protein
MRAVYKPLSFDVVLCGFVVWCGMVWWFGIVSCCLVRFVVIWHCLVCLVWFDVVW